MSVPQTKLPCVSPVPCKLTIPEMMLCAALCHFMFLLLTLTLCLWHGCTLVAVTHCAVWSQFGDTRLLDIAAIQSAAAIGSLLGRRSEERLTKVAATSKPTELGLELSCARSASIPCVLRVRRGRLAGVY